MEPVNRRRWQERPPLLNPVEEQKLASVLNLRPLTVSVLVRRGIDREANARQFLDGGLNTLPDPFLLKGMEAATTRLQQAIGKGETILVHGDYDVDGISGSALLVEGIKKLGGTVDYHIPLRLRDGYGLSAEALQQAAQGGIRVVLSVDCGISACDEAELARRLGIDLIITDHHQPPEQLPEATAIINPHQPGCEFPFKALAGVGVAFFLLVALRKRLRETGYFSQRPEPDLRHSLDLVALGTIADIVPLHGVNRLLTRTGLSLLEMSRRPGVVALKEVAGVDQVSCGSVGFRLAPRLNAAGRLEDAALGVELLLGTEKDRCDAIADQLDSCNRERQQIEQETCDAAVKLVADLPDERRTLVLAQQGWHPGVIGIVASRMVERYARPAVLIALEGESGKGSARSVAGFHLYKALQSCSEYLDAFGGHAFAAGLSLATARLEDFVVAFEAKAAALDEEALTPLLQHDGEVRLDELDIALLNEIERLAPFGAGNAEPAFIATGLRAQQVRLIGSDQSHLACTLRQDGFSHAAIGFGMARRREEFEGEIDILFTPQRNDWKGRTTLQLRIRDIRPSQSLP